MAFAPVDYGPQVSPDTGGVEAAQRAVQQHEAVFQEARQLGSVVQGGAQVITQGILHTQALKATAAVKERQASTLQFIDSNPYVPKATLQQRMTPEDYTAWHAGLATEYQKAEAVPMFSAAGALFDSEAKQAREQAGALISLPGWRDKWHATEQTESSVIRERYVNRLAADQMIADQRAQALLSIDRMVDAAVKPEDLGTAAKAAETNPWLKPAERRFAMEKALAAKDSFTAQQAMLAGDTEVMQAELQKLKSPDAAATFPNLNVKQRLALEQQLNREYSYKFAKDIAEKQIVGPNVDEHGKVNATAIADALGAYKGPHKEEVTKAVKVEEAEKKDIFDKKMVDVQKIVLRAGQDPMTAVFDYSRAMKSPEARKAAAQLNQDAPWLIRALSAEDQRRVAIESRETRAEEREAKLKLQEESLSNLEAIHKLIDDPTNAENLRKLTPAQFDSQLYEQNMTEPHRKQARAAFAAFIKNGPDERPGTVVAAEISAAANGDPDKIKQLKSKYSDSLLESAHAFIRANPTLPPDKMTDALRSHVKSRLLSGKVVGSSGSMWPDETVRRIEWETKAEYAGKPFKLKDGTVITSATQRTRLTKDGVSGTFEPDDVAAARADGWK